MDILKHISDSLLMEKEEIVKFSVTAPYRYKIYQIAKRNSDKTRTIAHPSRELKFIQRIIADYLLEKLPAHPSAYAYKKQISIKDNAAAHLNSKYLLKMDFVNFFPSITPRLFFSKLRKNNIVINDDDKVVLENFLFFKSKRNSQLRLSIGAPSSPLISNFVMYNWDLEVNNLCINKGITYTRYADDLTFSTNNKNILFDIPSLLENILIKYSLGKIRVNHEKTIFSSKRHNRHVTGITLTNDNKLSLGRERKRKISAMIHYYLQDKLQSTDINKLKGLLSFAKHIEPPFYQSMIKKYGIENISSLL